MAETKPVELTDAEIDAVAGGLNAIGNAAQQLGGEAVGTTLSGAVSALGGQAAAEQIVRLAQATV